MARRRKMDPERKAFINSLLEHYQPKDAQDIQDMLKDLLGETLEGMLKKFYGCMQAHEEEYSSGSVKQLK